MAKVISYEITKLGKYLKAAGRLNIFERQLGRAGTGIFRMDMQI